MLRSPKEVGTLLVEVVSVSYEQNAKKNHFCLGLEEGFAIPLLEYKKGDWNESF